MVVYLSLIYTYITILLTLPYHGMYIGLNNLSLLYSLPLQYLT